MGVSDAPLLRASGLRRRYGGRVVVDVAELTVRRGEVLAVLGPNGAGKSTLFRLLCLLERPDAGRIILAGRDLRAGDRDALRRIAGVFQAPFLFSGTVKSNVAFGLRARGIGRADRERRTVEALEELGLTALADAPVHTLSGGEARRVALARALAVRPDLLLLDEPTANLDVTVRRRFRRDLKRLVRGQAGAAVLITHDPADAFALADRIAVLDAGRVVQTGPPEAVVLRPATPFVAAFTGAELLLDGVVRAAEDGVVRVEMAGGQTLLAATAPDGEAAEAGAVVHVAYRPEDVTLAPPDHPAGTSARNRFRLRVAGIAPSGGLVRVHLEGPVTLVALVTRGSAEALGLEVGREVAAQLKATALRVYAAPPAEVPSGGEMNTSQREGEPAEARS